MSYSEENGLVVLRMTREDYDRLLIILGKSERAVPDLKNKTRAEITAWRREHDPAWNPSHSEARKALTAQAATIPPELSSCVAAYVERLLEQKAKSTLVSHSD